MARFTYRVQGRWPFPVDMLRFDDSVPATDEDGALVKQLSTEYSQDDTDVRKVYEVTLVHDGRSSMWWPTDRRWASYFWQVVPNSRRRES